MNRFERFTQLLKSAGVQGVIVFVINLIAFVFSIVYKEAVICLKSCSGLVGFYDHPVWFFIIMFIHSVLFIWGLSAIWKALK